MLIVESIHHVSLSVTDLQRSKYFYGELLGLQELNRPAFDFPGAWYQIGNQQLHLIVYKDSSTIRNRNNIDSKDGHFAIRVKDYHETAKYLRETGIEIYENPMSKSGFAQIFCTDPDGNLIEFNVDQDQVKNTVHSKNT